MMSLVEQELLVFPTFTPAVSNVQSLVFCSIFTVLHVPTGYVTDRTDIVHMDVLKVLKETVVIC
jgi:hypothetical protein